MQNGQTEQKQGFSLVLLARRRTKVRRVARVVRSIKHKINNNFILLNILRGFCSFITCRNPLIYIVLCGLRFFYIPFFIIL